ncbi:MAG: chemotaxis protein MotB [Bdellovibrionaceae bacterium]|nr:chemotaxis protein MotB [Bdellovibrio sp.]
MAQKKQTIVIKKIIIQGGGHHGGSWKVALADFMTAMMAFFLVMWLIGQNDETKKAVSDYFSTPSMIEYNFQNFGAELTLEKLFLDLINEPLKAFQSFLEPSDKTPNILDMGSAKVVAAFMADKMTDNAKNVNISQDGFDFDIPDTLLFEKGTSTPNKKFLEVMTRLVQITSGLQESEVKLNSAMFIQAVQEKTEESAKKIAQDRLDLVRNKIKASFEHTNNTIIGGTSVKDKKGEVDQEKLIGFIRVSIHQKEDTTKKRRKLETVFGDKDSAKNVYDNFASQIANQQKADQAKKSMGEDPNLVNPVDLEMQNVQRDSEPSSGIESTTISN